MQEDDIGLSVLAVQPDLMDASRDVLFVEHAGFVGLHRALVDRMATGAAARFPAVAHGLLVEGYSPPTEPDYDCT